MTQTTNTQAQAFCLTLWGFRFWQWLQSHVRPANAQLRMQWHCTRRYYKKKLGQMSKNFVFTTLISKWLKPRTHKLKLFVWLREVFGFGSDCSPMFGLQMHKFVCSGIAGEGITKKDLGKCPKILCAPRWYLNERNRARTSLSCSLDFARFSVLAVTAVPCSACECTSLYAVTSQTLVSQKIKTPANAKNLVCTTLMTKSRTSSSCSLDFARFSVLAMPTVASSACTWSNM